MSAIEYQCNRLISVYRGKSKDNPDQTVNQERAVIFMGNNIDRDKFKEFDQMINEAKDGRIDMVIIGWPEDLGDNYDEIIENLARIADAELTMSIRTRKP